MSMSLENIQRQLKIKYLNNLINICNKQNIDDRYIKKYLSDMNIEDDNSINITEVSITESEKPEYFYIKPWNKLTSIHKIIKIKEFVNNLIIDNEDEKIILRDKLIELIKNKNIKNKINYDIDKGKIISISQLACANNKYTIIE
jgi:hypothetical protein